MSLLKKTLLMGVLLSGILLSSQTVMAGSENFKIHSPKPCAYTNYVESGPDEFKVVASNDNFTINCKESFNGTVTIFYSLFRAEIFFQNGKFTYMELWPLMGDAVSALGHDIYIEDKSFDQLVKVIDIKNSSKKDFKFKDFSSSFGSSLILLSRPDVLLSGETKKVIFTYDPFLPQLGFKLSYITGSLGSLGFTIKINIVNKQQQQGSFSKSAIDYSVSSLLGLKVSGDYDGGTVTILDNQQPAVSNTFTIVNKTDRNFLFKGFESYVGDVNLTNYNIVIPKNGIKKFTIAYPKPDPDQQHHPAFTISYTSGFTSCLMQFIVDGQKIFFKENIFPPIPIAIKLDEDGSIVISSTK